MTTIKATVRGRRLELDVPVDWPDGTQVEIHPLAEGNGDAMSPEEIAETLAAMDRVVPFEMTAAEEAALQAERQARKEAEKGQFRTDAERLRRAWE